MNLMSPTSTTKESTKMDHPMVPLLLVLIAYPTWLVLTTSPTMLAAPLAIFAFWLLLRKKLYFVAGLITALCVFRIEWLPFFLIPGLILGGLHFFAGSALAAVGTFFAAQMMHQPLDMAALFSASQGALPTHTLQNFAAMLVLILGENTTNLQIGTLAVYIVAIISSTELWWRIHHLVDSQNRFLRKCAATVLITLTASAHTTVQDYIALIPVFVWLWQTTADDTKDTGGLVRKVMISYPILTWLYFAAQTAFPGFAVPVYFVWAVVLSVTVLPTLDVEVNNILNRRFKAQSS
ncbi:MAG: hypothetical protein HYX67_06120 [Candidatus Melainabacteria bacterium]|nr:hypothetical protein [Candidatus Melainabacteria bacterium]